MERPRQQRAALRHEADCPVPFGESVKVGPEAEFVINRLKFNDLVLNRNAADFWGYRSDYGSTTGNSLESINAVLIAQGLPRIRVWDGYYLADNSTRKGSPTCFIPTANGILFAPRTSGAKAGEFAMTYNANNGKLVHEDDLQGRGAARRRSPRRLQRCPDHQVPVRDRRRQRG